MALEVTDTIPFSKTCGTMYFTDDTPDYNADTAPGGYGAPNATKASITSTKIIFTDSDGVEHIYSDYLPTQGEVELTPDLFAPPIGTVVETTTDDDCGCENCPDPVVSDTSLFPDGCGTMTYEVYVGDALTSSYSEDVFWDCVTMVRIVANLRANLCGSCDQELQDALRKATQYHDESLLVYQNGGCECAQNLLDKANEILEDVENDVI